MINLTSAQNILERNFLYYIQERDNLGFICLCTLAHEDSNSFTLCWEGIQDGIWETPKSKKVLFGIPTNAKKPFDES